MEDEKNIKNVLSRIDEIEPGINFESRVMEKIQGVPVVQTRISAWRLVPVPLTAVLLMVLTLVGGNFASVYAGKLKEYGSSKLAADIAKNTLPVSSAAIKRFCGDIKKRGVVALLGPARVLCIMEECGEIAQACAAACNENGGACR